MHSSELKYVFDFDIPPPVLEVFRGEPPMAMFRRRLAAKQATAVDDLPIELIFHSSLAHQGKKSGLVFCPITLVLFVLIQHFLGGRKFGNMQIGNRNDRIAKKAQIVFL